MSAYNIGKGLDQTDGEFIDLFGLEFYIKVKEEFYKNLRGF